MLTLVVFGIGTFVKIRVVAFLEFPFFTALIILFGRPVLPTGLVFVLALLLFNGLILLWVVLSLQTLMTFAVRPLTRFVASFVRR